MAHSRDTAQQVRSEYIDTMAKIYFSYFKDYYSKLMKIQVWSNLLRTPESGVLYLITPELGEPL